MVIEWLRVSIYIYTKMFYLIISRDNPKAVARCL